MNLSRWNQRPLEGEGKRFLFSQAFHEEVKEERVGVSVEHSDSFIENVFEMRVKGVPNV